MLHRSIRKRLIPSNISSSPQEISLLKCNFNALITLPRSFKITTNNNSGEFNTDILIKTSEAIPKLNNTSEINSNEFHIIIKDNKNVLKKIESLYQGEAIVFEEDELITLRAIKRKLLLRDFPDISIYHLTNRKSNFIWHENSGKFFNYTHLGVKINQLLLKDIISKNSIPPFTIQTNKKEYKCNFNGVLSSLVIKELVTKDSKVDRYSYNFEDDNNEFQFICDLFNFQKIELTKNNVDAIIQIAEDLKIECIYDVLDTFISDDEKVTQKINDQQDVIDSTNDIFDLLYNLKEKTIEYALNVIINSKWSKTEEAVYELAAFILQVVQTDFTSHDHLIDLLIKLDEYDDGDNKLKILIPFITNNLTFFFNEYSNNLIYCSFIYKMYKRGKIPRKIIDNCIIKSDINKNNVYSWFLPEVIEINPKVADYLDNQNIQLMYPCDLTNIEEYKKLRDNGECNDELAKALRNDDIEKFQSFVSASEDLIKKGWIKQNIFEPFFFSRIRYLNYAAAYGSIKCFKYMLLNNEEFDDSTFKLAIMGGNAEIIRIIYNEKDKIKSKKNIVKSNRNISEYNLIEFNQIDVLSQLIRMHRNNIFDWIFEQTFYKIDKKKLLNLVICSIENGNLYSLVQIIDHGYNFHSCEDKYSLFIEQSSKKGFYSLLNFLYKLIKENSNIENIISSKLANCSVYFGNVYIFRLLENYIDSDELEKILLFAIKAGYFNIVKYFCENILNHIFKLNFRNVIQILINSFQNSSTEILDYLINEIEDIFSLINKSFNVLITNTYNCNNFEATKKISELFYKNNPELDFSDVLESAIINDLNEVAKYYIDMGYQIDFSKLTKVAFQNGSIDVEIFSMIYNKVESNEKENMLKCIDKAIIAKNKPLIKLLLKEKAPLNNILVHAASTDDIEIVDMILKEKIDPSILNQNSTLGTPLFISVKNNNLKIFNKLISFPEINPSIYNKKFMTPLVLAASELQVEMFNSILDFYGEDIKNQYWQIEKAINAIFIKSYIDIEDPKNKISTILHTIIGLNCIDINHFYNKCTLLTFVCENNLNDVTKTILQNDAIDVNIYDPNTGDTPLNIAIQKGNIDIAKLLIEHPKTDFYQQNYIGKSAFWIAIDCHEKEIIEILLQNKRFELKENEINEAFYISDTEIAKLLLTFNSLDVNYVPFGTQKENILNNKKKVIHTPLIKSIISTNPKEREIFDHIIQHPSFCKTEFNQCIDIIIVILVYNRFDIFSKFFDLFEKNHHDIDINSLIFENDSLLVYSISNNINKQMIECILNYKSFDSKKSDICKAFEICCTNFKLNDVIDKMNLLYDYDDKHDQLFINKLKESQQSFEKIGTFKPNLLDFILQRDFDPNKPNKDGVYPLEYSIMNKLSDMTYKLINSGKVDFRKQIETKSGESKYTTYLHLLARVDMKIINLPDSWDINITNDLGETPLMEACRYGNTTFITDIFKFDNLYYNHQNNKGEDAIEILRKIKCPNEDEFKYLNKFLVSKIKYMNILIRLINKESKKSNNIIMFDFNKMEDENSIKTPAKQDEKTNNSTEKQDENAIKTPAKQDENAIKTPAKQDEKTNNSTAKHDENAIKTPAKHDENAIKTPAKHDENAIKTPAKHDENANNSTRKQDGNANKIVFSGLNKPKTDLIDNKHSKVSKYNFDFIKSYVSTDAQNNKNEKIQSSDVNACFNKTISEPNKANQTSVKHIQPLMFGFNHSIQNEPKTNQASEKQQEQPKINFNLSKTSKESIEQNNVNHSTMKLHYPNGQKGFCLKIQSTPISETNFAQKNEQEQTDSVFLTDQNNVKTVAPTVNLHLSEQNSNLVCKSVQITPTTDFKTYYESFSEKPNPIENDVFNKNQTKLQHKNQSSFDDDDNSYNETTTEFNNKRKVGKINKALVGEDDGEPQNYLPFIDHNQMALLQQQQQQWLQMIEMNNMYQNQINMQLMNQFQMNVDKQHKKKKKKNNQK